MLQLLTLLSAKATWRADELAGRLEVTERSVRRDVTRLRTLGYPIESVTGPYGGYSLAAGGRLPPLLLSDDEAVSMAVALHDISQRSSAIDADSALSALTKLGQVMPAALRERVGALTSVVVGVTAAADRFADGTGNVETLMAVALSCSRSERLRFDYRTGEGTESVRHTEPFRLVSVSQRWYLVAFDVDRADWRTFRVDRITRPRSTGARFQRTEVPDAAALVAEGLAVNAWEQRALVRVHAPLAEVAEHVSPTIGLLRTDPADEARTLLEIGGDADWVARYISGLPHSFEVIEPAALIEELHALGRRLLATEMIPDAPTVRRPVRRRRAEPPA